MSDPALPAGGGEKIARLFVLVALAMLGAVTAGCSQIATGPTPQPTFSACNLLTADEIKSTWGTDMTAEVGTANDCTLTSPTGDLVVYLHPDVIRLETARQVLTDPVDVTVAGRPSLLATSGQPLPEGGSVRGLSLYVDLADDEPFSQTWVINTSVADTPDAREKLLAAGEKSVTRLFATFP